MKKDLLSSDRKKFISIIFLFTASQVGLFLAPILGLYINTVVFAVCIVTALKWSHMRNVFLAIAILPIATMVSLVLPQEDLVLQLAIYYGVIFVLASTYWLIFRRVKQEKGLQPINLVVVFTLLIATLLIILITGNAIVWPGLPLALVVLGVLYFAVTEELLFRSLIQGEITKFVGMRYAVVGSAMLYVVSAINHTILLMPLLALITGLSLSFIYAKRQNLLLTSCMNAFFKGILLLYFALNVK